MFKGGLGYDLAQKIVDSIMGIVKYNINIMDKSGYIIASGSPSRIKKLHMGAIKALELQEPYYIYEDTEMEKKGINVPFRYQNEIVGVIGVSGEPAQVEEIAHIVRATAELMIEKQFYDNKAYAQETRVRDLINDIIAHPSLQTEKETISRMKEYGLDLNVERNIVIFRLIGSDHDRLDLLKSYLGHGEYIVKESNQDAIVLLVNDQNMCQRIEHIISNHPCLSKAYVGFSSTDIQASYASALSMVNIAERLRLTQKVLSIDDYIIEEIAFKLTPDGHHQKIYNRFLSHHNHEELSETLIAYVQSGFDKSQTCTRLFIHKNTLYYRMQRIEEITGMNTQNLRDMILLYMTLLKNSYISTK
jgi:carbohydrate diacid regulator